MAELFPGLDDDVGYSIIEYVDEVGDRNTVSKAWKESVERALDLDTRRFALHLIRRLHLIPLEDLNLVSMGAKVEGLLRRSLKLVTRASNNPTDEMRAYWVKQKGVGASSPELLTDGEALIENETYFACYVPILGTIAGHAMAKSNHHSFPFEVHDEYLVWIGKKMGMRGFR